MENSKEKFIKKQNCRLYTYDRKTVSDSTEKGLTIGDSEVENSVFYTQHDEVPKTTADKDFEDPKKTTYTNDAFEEDLEKGTFRPSYDHLTSVDAINPEESDESKKNTFGLETVKQWIKSRRKYVQWSIKISLFLAYNTYLGFAIYLTWDEAITWCQGIKFLTLITIVSYTFAFNAYIFKPFLLKPIRRSLKPTLFVVNKLYQLKYFNQVCWCFSWGTIIVFLIFDTQDNRYRLVSAGGAIVLVFLGYVFSKHRKQIVWRHILWGTLIQFVIGVLILRWSVGKDIFQCFGDKVMQLLDATDQGSTFVFGYLVSGQLKDSPVQPAIFAFKVLSVIIFFSFIVSIFYYYGAMQLMVTKVGWLLQNTIGTTACESMNAAGNIFLGMTEAPLLIRPYLPYMTKSELHAVLTGGFATIAGSVLAAYINFGINASHLLSASVMSAPAALAYSKLVYPEVEESCTLVEDIKIENGSETNALEAATNGATAAIKLVSNIAANLIAFVAFISLLDGILAFLGSLVHLDFLSFQWLMSKAFIPLSLLMGVDWDDKERVANLIGLKTVVNEFVAYAQLAKYQDENLLTARSNAIATFALCGFSNISSIGIQIGSLSAMAPERKSDFAKVAVRAMIAGSAACFMTACVAGTLLKV